MSDRDESASIDAAIENVVAGLLDELGFTDDPSTCLWEKEARIYERLVGALSAGVIDSLDEHQSPSSTPQTTADRNLPEGLGVIPLSLLKTISTTYQTSPEFLLKRVKHLRRRAQVQHNASRPFNQLPTEIGCGIFAAALAPARTCAPYYRNLHQLRLVCSQWLHAIDAEPSFWTFLSNRAPLSAWSAILQNSQTSPLRMDFNGWTVGPSPNTPILRRIQFLEAASAQIHRIKSLSLSLSGNADSQLSLDESQYLKSMLESPAPLLEALHLHAGTLHPYVEIRFSGTMPRLRDVGVSDWAVPLLDTISWANLQALSLSGRSTSLPLDRLREILSATPNLVHLDVNGGLDTNAVPLFGPQPTTLSALKTVHIVQVSPDNISSALTFFRAPSADYIALSGLKWMEHPAHLEEHLSQHIASFIQVQPPGTVLRVRCWEVCVTINQKLFSLEGAHDGDHPYAMRRTLTYLPPTTLPVHLSVEEQLDWHEPEELLITLHSAFPYTFELGLPSASRLDRHLLGTPLDSNSTQWIFPNMKRLNLNGPAPATKTLRRAVKIAAARKESGIPLDSVHVMPHTPYCTPCYRRILRETESIVSIICDAASSLPREPSRQWFSRLDDPLTAGGSWFTINEPEVEVSEAPGYEVSTSDEEEPQVEESSEDETDSDASGGESGD